MAGTETSLLNYLNIKKLEVKKLINSFLVDNLLC